MNKSLLASLFVFVLTVIISCIISYTRWHADYQARFEEYCPDAYCAYSQVIHDLLDDKSFIAYRSFQDFIRQHIHGTSLLGPFINALLMFLFPNPVVAFQVLSIAATIGSFLVISKFLVSFMGISYKKQLLIMPLFILHFIVIRGINRPLSDAIGMFCTILSLYMIASLSKTYSHKKAFYFGFFFLICLFARLPVLFLIPMSSIWFLIEYFRTRQIRFLELLLQWGVIIPLIYIIINSSLGTFGSLFKAFEQGTRAPFTSSHTLKNFIFILIMSLQLFPFFMIRALKAPKSGEIPLHIFWIFFYLLVIIVGGGAFWNRYTAPIIPSIIILSAPGIVTLYERKKWIYVALIITFIILNIMAHMLMINSNHYIDRYVSIDLIY